MFKKQQKQNLWLKPDLDALPMSCTWAQEMQIEICWVFPAQVELKRLFCVYLFWRFTSNFLLTAQKTWASHFLQQPQNKPKQQQWFSMFYRLFTPPCLVLISQWIENSPWIPEGSHILLFDRAHKTNSWFKASAALLWRSLCGIDLNKASSGWKTGRNVDEFPKLTWTLKARGRHPKLSHKLKKTSFQRNEEPLFLDHQAQYQSEILRLVGQLETTKALEQIIDSSLFFFSWCSAQIRC